MVFTAFILHFYMSTPTSKPGNRNKQHTEKCNRAMSTRTLSLPGVCCALPLTRAQLCRLFWQQDISKCNTSRGLERACLTEFVCFCSSASPWEHAFCVYFCLLREFVFRIFISLIFPLRSVLAASYILPRCVCIFIRVKVRVNISRDFSWTRWLF